MKNFSLKRSTYLSLAFSCAVFLQGMTARAYTQGVSIRSGDATHSYTAGKTAAGSAREDSITPGASANLELSLKMIPPRSGFDNREKNGPNVKGASVNWEYGQIKENGEEGVDGYFRTLRSTFFLDCRDVIQWTCEVKNSSNFDLNVSVFAWDQNWNFLEKLSLKDLLSNRSSNARYIRLSIDFLPPGDHDSPLYVNAGMFELNMRTSTQTGLGLQNTKHPNSKDVIDIFYDFKRNLTSDVLSISESNPVRYSEDRVLGNGYLILPETYTPDGEPTRLIIFAHGSADTEPTPDRYRKYIDYLVNQGYAVADCHAWGRLRGPENPYIGSQFWGTPTNYASYQAFHSNLVKKYNLHKEIFLFGKSQGGLQVFGIPYNTTIPVKAACALAGESSPVGNQHGYTDADRFACYEDMGFSGLEKDSNGEYIGEAAVMKKKDLYDYEFTEERIAYYLKNKEKWMFYNPAMSGIINLPDRFNDLFPNVSGPDGNRGDFSNSHPFMKAAKAPKCPFICFVAKDDMYAASNRIKIQIEAGGGICVIRLMPSGNERPHNSVDSTAPTVSEIVTKSGVVCRDIPIPYVEMLEFFNLYE